MVPGAGRRARARGRDATASATRGVVAARVGRAGALAHRLAPRLRPRRRGVRRTARRRVGAGRGRPAAGARPHTAADRRGGGVRGGGGVAVRPGLPGLPARDRGDALAQARSLRDRDGVSLERRRWDGSRTWADAARRTSAASWSCTSSRAATWSTATPAVGVASAIWPHGRYRFDFTGEANHAGTTRMEDRHDPMLDLRDDGARGQQAGPACRAAGDLRPARRAAQRHQRRAVGGHRLARRPRRVDRRSWSELVAEVERPGRSGPNATAPRCSVTRESVSPAGGLRRPTWPRRWRGRTAWPVIPTMAGHDAGSPVRGRRADRDAVRAQPHRRLPLPRRARRDRRLPRRGRGARRHARWRRLRRVTAYWLERAWTGRRSRSLDGVLRSTSRTACSPPSVRRRRRPGAQRLPGLTLPGLANCHSHAFHRALRGRTQRERGTFWTWREQMYGARRAARRPTPTSSWRGRRTARWSPAGDHQPSGSSTTCTTPPDGTPYDESNAMGAGAGGGGARGRPPDRAARHLLPRRRDRVAAARACSSGSATATPTPGPSGSTRLTRLDGADVRVGRRDPLGARGAARAAGARRRMGRGSTERRCTCTCPSRSPRTTPAWRRTD